jgi:hypothetical protein
MTHGGKRTNAGRKPAQQTTRVRVPVEQAGLLKDLVKLDLWDRNQVWRWGDSITVPLVIGGELHIVQGIVRPGITQVPACEYPRQGKQPKETLINAPYDPPGTISVQYRWADIVGVVQINLDRLRLHGNGEGMDT